MNLCQGVKAGRCLETVRSIRLRFRALLLVLTLLVSLLASSAPAFAYTNPAYAQVNTWLEAAARKYDLPPQLIKAMAWQESGWAQYWADGSPKISFDGGIGIMQLTNKPQFDQNRLKTDPEYNIDCGAQILKASWDWNNYQNRLVGLPDDDKDLLENWYYAAAKYNGWNNPEYPLAIHNHMRTPPWQIAGYLPAVDVTLPSEVIPGFAFGNYASAFKSGQYRWYYTSGSLRGTFPCSVHNWRDPTPPPLPPPPLPPSQQWIASGVVVGNAPGSWATGSQGWTPVNFNVTTGPWPVNVRSGPGTNYPVVRTISANTPVACYGWQHGGVVADAWTGASDARWYRIDQPAAPSPPPPPPAAPAKLEAVSVSLPDGTYRVGKTLTCTFTVKNTGGQTGTWNNVIYALRGPGETNRDMGPNVSVTLAPGETKTFVGTRVLDADGSWHGWVAATSGGNWIDCGGPRTFSVLPKIATTITLAAPSTVTYGSPGTLSAKLFAGSTLLTGKTLEFQTSYDNRTWTTIRRLSSLSGNLTMSIGPTRKTYYRVRFTGDATYTGCSSASRLVTPLVYLTAPYAPSIATRGVSFDSYGFLKPRHTPGTYPVQIECYLYEAGRWLPIMSVSARAGDYSTYTRYAARMSLPYSGNWRIRAYRPASPSWGATSSAWRYLTVH